LDESGHSGTQLTRGSPRLLDFHYRFEPGTSGGTLLLLHGTGGNEDDLIPLGREIAPRANLLAPRGQVLENGMPRFFRRITEGVFDEADLVLRAEGLDRFVRGAVKQHGADPARVRAFGYSNGANMAAALLLLHGSLLAGAALLRAVLPLEPPALPDLTGRRVLIAAGRQDPYAPIERVQALSDRLQSAGAMVDLRWSAGGHAPEPEEIEALVSWFQDL
jgi:phospholipase/carboxylesterase